jgi:hypothetical protein
MWIAIMSNHLEQVALNSCCKKKNVAPNQKDNHINMWLQPTFHPSNVAWLFYYSFLLLKCVVTYDKKLGCIHMKKNCPLDLDKVFPQNDVHMEINNILDLYNQK